MCIEPTLIWLSKNSPPFMARKAHPGKDLPLHPKHPERICWGCDVLFQRRPGCGNGSDRTPAPRQLLGEELVRIR